MKNELLFFAVLCAVAWGLDDDNRRKHKPAATLSPPGEFNLGTSPSTTPKPTPVNPTTKPAPKPTPVKSTTEPTPKPIPTNHTTKPAPKPTPANTTTISPKPFNTTAVKPTTHKIVTTSMPKPTPSTNLTVGNYTLKNTQGSPCVKAVMAVQIMMETSKPNEKGVFIIQPKQTTVVGDCSESDANFTLNFKEGSLSLLFRKNATTKSVYVHSVSFDVNYVIVHSGPAHNSRKNESVKLFETNIGKYYSCKNMSLFMGQGCSVEMTALKLQAFNFTNNDFGLPEDCPADKMDYRVAIAVGVVLLILILIVVVAYLVGRRRRTDGYQTL